MGKELSYKELLPNLRDLKLRSVLQTQEGWLVEAGGSSRAVCPRCGVVSRSRHSRYWRRLKDLPLQGASVTIKLQLGRWRCRNRKCERKIFTERVPGVLVPHAQQTVRLGEIRMLVGRGLGGRPGERLMSRLGMAASRHTLLRQVIRAARGCALTDVIRVVGVDDWAWSKGQSFGTILVDLERGEVVDLLPTRSADALCEWLTQHPEVDVVSRDRHGICAEGARRGAPEAVQVADRFHLMLNLRQAVEREPAVQRRHLRVTPPSTPTPPLALRTEPAKSQSREVQVSSSVWKQQAEAARQGRQEKLELFQTIRRVQGAGQKVSQIAKHLGINRRRIDKWVRLDTFPERSRMQPRLGMAESFHDYLHNAGTPVSGMVARYLPR